MRLLINEGVFYWDVYRAEILLKTVRACHAIECVVTTNLGAHTQAAVNLDIAVDVYRLDPKHGYMARKICVGKMFGLGKPTAVLRDNCARDILATAEGLGIEIIDVPQKMPESNDWVFPATSEEWSKIFYQPVNGPTFTEVTLSADAIKTPKRQTGSYGPYTHNGRDWVKW